MTRVRRMLKRLSPNARENYVKHCKKLIDKGVMRPVNETDEPGLCYLVNAVLERDSATTPIRLIFTHATN